MNPTVTIKSKKVKGASVGYEGVVEVPGLKNTKLVKNDGTSVFKNQPALKSCVRALSKRTGLNFETVVPTVKTVRKAAKKSSTK